MPMEQIRTFVAIELDKSIKDGLADLQDQLKAKAPKGAVRWVRPEGIHLTLKFLGNVPVERIEGVIKALEEACQGFSPFSLSVGGLGCFPNLKRPRVIWVGVEEPTGELAALQAAIEKALVKLGFQPEERKFQPHLTLGRLKRQASRGQPQRLGELIESMTIGEIGEMEARIVSLMKSELKPTGAVYTRLAAVKLTG